MKEWVPKMEKHVLDEIKNIIDVEIEFSNLSKKDILFGMNDLMLNYDNFFAELSHNPNDFYIYLNGREIEFKIEEEIKSGIEKEIEKEIINTKEIFNNNLVMKLKYIVGDKTFYDKDEAFLFAKNNGFVDIKCEGEFESKFE